MIAVDKIDHDTAKPDVPGVTIPLLVVSLFVYNTEFKLTLPFV